MLARPRPSAFAARVRARFEAGEALIDIGDETEPPHLAVSDDIDAGLCLSPDDFGDGALDASGKSCGVERPAPLFRLDHVQQIGRPR